MGIVCGTTALVEEKEFDSIVSDPYEVRIYPSMVVAEVKCGENAFTMLLQYIGLLGIPENVKAAHVPQSPGNIAVTHEKFSLILPVLKQENMLQLVLPTKYENANDYPMPKNPEVSIKTLAQRIVAVHRFKGSCDHERCLVKLKKLHKRLVIDNLINKDTPKALVEDTQDQQVSQSDSAGQANNADDSSRNDDRPSPQRKLSNADAVSWVIARYHPPWAFPLLLRNEVWIELSPAMPAVAALIDKAALLHTDKPALYESVSGDVGTEGKEGEIKTEAKEGTEAHEERQEQSQEEEEKKEDAGELHGVDIGALAEQAQSLVDLGEHIDSSSVKDSVQEST